MIDFLTSDPAIVLFATLGLLVTGMNIVRDARAQRAKVVRRPVLVQDRAAVIEPREIAA